MVAKKTNALRTLAVYLLLAVLLCGSYPTYRYWRQYQEEDQRKLSEKKNWVYGRVQSSAAGSQSFMATVAREFTGEHEVYVGACDWFAVPMWRHTTKNPNWFSDVKGSDGMKVIGECGLKGPSDYSEEMQFEWEWEDGRGVIAVSWGWAPFEP